MSYRDKGELLFKVYRYKSDSSKFSIEIARAVNKSVIFDAAEAMLGMVIGMACSASQMEEELLKTMKNIKSCIEKNVKTTQLKRTVVKWDLT